MQGLVCVSPRVHSDTLKQPFFSTSAQQAHRLASSMRLLGCLFCVSLTQCPKPHSVWLWLYLAITEVLFDIRVPYNTDKRWGVPITVLQQKTETITNKKEQTL